jgi:Outer membrane protein transport protein (OMPP1/FadL/TodX)
MKKYISLFSLAFCFNAMQAQDVADAFRYAQDNTNGTARFRAMGGAFGALGGDLSAINVNPAGSAIFANNQVVGSLSSFNVKNNSTYFGKKTSDSDNTLDLNQAGGVFVFENTNGQSGWKKFSVALNYENTNNFDNKLYSGGYNPSRSGVQYFLNNANGIALGILEDYFYDELDFKEQQASLAYQSFLINPSTTNTANTSYFSNITGTGNFYQENEVVSTGYNGKFTFNAAAQYGDFLFIGLNLNTHFTDYRKSTSFYEDNFDANGANPNAGVQSFRFNNDLYTYGNGFSFNLGAIFKPTKELRLGIAFESPTWLTLNDELTQSLSTNCANCVQPSYNENPGVVNVYAPYKVQTPAKGTASFAYVFAKRGLISFDYGLKDYSNTKFKPVNDTYFKSLNNTIARNAREFTSEYRVGAEYRIKQFSLRGGYRFEQSPYKDAATLGNLTSYSGGIGYNFGGTKLDISYTNTQQDYNQQFLSQGMTDAAKINAKNNNVTVTLGFDL